MTNHDKLKLKQDVEAANQEVKAKIWVEVEGELVPLYIQPELRECLHLYQEIFEMILKNLDQPNADSRLESIRDSFDEAKATKDVSKLKAVKLKLSVLFYSSEISKHKETITPLLEKINDLMIAFMEQRKLVDKIENTRQNFMQKLGIRVNPIQVRSDELIKMDKELAEALSRLKSIAEELAKAELDYHKKYVEYVSSVDSKTTAVFELLDRWDNVIEDAKEIGFLQHCSLGLSQLLTRMFSAIKHFISTIKESVSSDSKAYKEATNDLVLAFTIDDEDDEDDEDTSNSFRAK